jgi:hypothetical protein
MLENTKIEGVFNLYQYLCIFLITVVLNTIVRFFSVRKYASIKLNSVDPSNQIAIGFLPELGPFYSKLGNYGPKNYIGLPDDVYKTINSWFVSCFSIGITVVLIVLIADLILHYFDKENI